MPTLIVAIVQVGAPLHCHARFPGLCHQWTSPAPVSHVPRVVQLAYVPAAHGLVWCALCGVVSQVVATFLLNCEKSTPVAALLAGVDLPEEDLPLFQQLVPIVMCVPNCVQHCQLCWL
jgi:hypothetical protein